MINDTTGVQKKIKRRVSGVRFCEYNSFDTFAQFETPNYDPILTDAYLNEGMYNYTAGTSASKQAHLESQMALPSSTPGLPPVSYTMCFCGHTPVS